MSWVLDKKSNQGPQALRTYSRKGLANNNNSSANPAAGPSIFPQSAAIVLSSSSSSSLENDDEDNPFATKVFSKLIGRSALGDIHENILDSLSSEDDPKALNKRRGVALAANEDKIRRKADLKDIISKGNSDDANFLSRSISTFHTDAKSRQTHIFAVRIPLWESASVERLKVWLQDLGFDYYYPGGLEMMKFSVKELGNLERLLSKSLVDMKRVPENDTNSVGPFSSSSSETGQDCPPPRTVPGGQPTGSRWKKPGALSLRISVLGSGDSSEETILSNSSSDSPHIEPPTPHFHGKPQEGSAPSGTPTTAALISSMNEFWNLGAPGSALASSTLADSSHGQALPKSILGIAVPASMPSPALPPLVTGRSNRNRKQPSHVFESATAAIHSKSSGDIATAVTYPTKISNVDQSFSKFTFPDSNISSLEAVDEDSDASTILDTDDVDYFDPDEIDAIDIEVSGDQLISKGVAEHLAENAAELHESSPIRSLSKPATKCLQAGRMEPLTVKFLDDFPSLRDIQGIKFDRRSSGDRMSIASADAATADILLSNFHSCENGEVISPHQFGGSSFGDLDDFNFAKQLPFGGNSMNSRRNSSIDSAGHRLIRSQSMPAPHFHGHSNGILAGDVTPGGVQQGGMSLSQPEKPVAEFRTPNSAIHSRFTTYGGNGYDWGVTQPAHSALIREMETLSLHQFHELGPTLYAHHTEDENANVFSSKPHLQRSITIGNFGNRVIPLLNSFSSDVCDNSTSDYHQTPTRLTRSSSDGGPSSADGKRGDDHAGVLAFCNRDIIGDNCDSGSNRNARRQVPIVLSASSLNLPSNTSPRLNSSEMGTRLDKLNAIAEVDIARQNFSDLVKVPISSHDDYLSSQSIEMMGSPGMMTFDDIKGRQKKKLNRSLGKWKRMSIGFSTSNNEDMKYGRKMNVAQLKSTLEICEEADEEMDVPSNETNRIRSSISPAVKSKFSSGQLIRRRNQIAVANNSHCSEDSVDLHMMRHVSEHADGFENSDTSHVLDDSMNEQDELNHQANTSTASLMISSVFSCSSLYSNHQQVLSYSSKNVSSCLNELTFKGIVIGGSYQHCFEENQPVIAPPSSTDKRIVGASVESLTGILTVKVLIPKDKTAKDINLGKNWKWIRCSPNGYLVYKGELMARKKSVCYYINRLPDTADSMAIDPPFSFVSNMKVDSDCPSEFARHQSYFQRNVKSISSSSLETGLDERGTAYGRFSKGLALNFHGISSASSSSCSLYNPDHDDAMVCVADPINSSSMDNIMLNLSSTSINKGIPKADHMDEPLFSVYDEMEPHSPIHGTDSAGVDEEDNTTHIDWNNANIVAVALEFLFDIHQSQDLVSYRLVCKSWALASYRLLAKHLSNSSNSQPFKYQNWAKFMSKYNWGIFLSQGACKEVYCVQSSQIGLQEAVSVMDIDDLEERDMGDAVTQELEISMICSSLVSLGICPNLVQVHSVFQSEYPPQASIWRSSQPRPQIETSSFASSGGIGSGGRLGVHRSNSGGSLAASTGHLLSTSSSSSSLSAMGAAIALPKSRSMKRGRFQYIRMEFCGGGDLEELVRKSLHRQLDVGSVRRMLLQMFFSVYSCREQISLRHYDLKLLNFFVTTGSSLLPLRQRQAIEHRRNNSSSNPLVQGLFNDTNEQKSVSVKIGFGSALFKFNLHADNFEVVKLADFGTSAIGMGGLGDPITVQQFTTLENTPPEFLILGSGARQSFAADTFCLGLATLHLATGHEPYEELLKDVKCPTFLENKLRKIWSTKNSNSTYFVISEVINSLESDDADEDPGMVLYHTLYRYFVLFGVPADLQDNSSNPYQGNPVWAALVDSLSLDDINSQIAGAADLTAAVNGGNLTAGAAVVRAGKKNSLKSDAIAQFRKDRLLWSLHHGSNDIMRSARSRLSLLGVDSMSNLEKMVHFDCSKRCTMHDLILSKMFHSIRDTEPLVIPGPDKFRLGKPPRGNGSPKHDVSYLHYHRSDAIGSEGLPMF